MVLFEKCQGKTAAGADCIEDIEEQVRNKQILIYANQKTFSDADMDIPYLVEAKAFWAPVVPQVKTNTVYRLEQGEVQTVDTLYRPFADNVNSTDSLF